MFDQVCFPLCPQVHASDDQSLIETNVENAVKDYINNLHIGDDVIRNRIQAVIMNESGVLDITLSAPASNVSVGSNQIGRTGTIAITFT